METVIDKYISVETIQRDLRQTVEAIRDLDPDYGIEMLEAIEAIEAANRKIDELVETIDRLRKNWPKNLPEADQSSSRSS